MKRTISSIVIITMLAFVAMSCGKKKSSGGGGNPYPYFNNLAPGFGQMPGQTDLLNQLNQWAQNGVESQNIGKAGVFKVKTDSISTSWFQFNFSIITSNFTPNYCYLSSDNINYSVGTPVNGICNVTANLTKQTNPALLRALTGENGALTLINIQASGPKVALYYSLPNSYNSQPAVVYVIDTSLHSVINPTEIHDYRIMKKDILTNFKVNLY